MRVIIAQLESLYARSVSRSISPTVALGRENPENSEGRENKSWRIRLIDAGLRVL